MKTKAASMFVFCFFLGAAAPAGAAVVYLRDGGRLSGTVVSATAGDVHLHTEDGVVRLSADRILRIDYATEERNEESFAPPAAPGVYKRPDYRDTFVLDIGLASPLSRLDAADSGGRPARNGGTGLRAGAEYLHSLSPRLSAGFGIHYFNRGSSDNLDYVPAGTSRISGHTLMPLVVAKVALTQDRPVQPYVLAGIGVNHTSTIVDTQPQPGFSWSDTGTTETRRLVDGDKWGLASRIALGLDFGPREPVSVSLEVGWMGVMNGRYDGTAAGRDVGLDSVTGNLNALSAGIRWGWRF